MIPKSRRRSRIERITRHLDWLQVNYWDAPTMHPACAEARALRWALDVLAIIDWSDPKFRATLND